MDILKQLNFSESSVVSMLNYACLFFISLMTLLLIFRMLEKIKYYFATKHLNRDKKIVRILLNKFDPYKLKLINNKNKYIQQYILELAELVEGDVRDKLLEIYQSLGFLEKDSKWIQSIFYYKRVIALTNLRCFSYPLPNHIWEYLLRDPHWEFRWASMEYLISVKEKYSLRWIIGFFAQKQNVNQGNLLHLLAHYATRHGASFPYLLEHTNDEKLRAALLKTLSSHPVPGSDAIIRASFNYMSKQSTIIAGLAALHEHPHNDNIEFCLQFLTYEDWEVRVALAKVCQTYPELLDALDDLSLDGSFEVRAETAKSLVELLPDSGRSVANILGDPNHPCFYFVKVFDIKIPNNRPRT